MIRVDLPLLGFSEVWRGAARALAGRRVPADQVLWTRGGAGDLFGGDAPPEGEGPHPVAISKAGMDLLMGALMHADPEAPALAYTALLRHQDARGLIANPADPLTRRLERLRKAVGREIHKTHAFVRFRETPSTGARRRFGAWFEPEHFILEAAAPFFRKRFGDMDWTIATPQGVAVCESGELRFEAPAPRPAPRAPSCPRTPPRRSGGPISPISSILRGSRSRR